MNVGEIIAGAGVGAAKSYFDNNVQQIQTAKENTRLAQEQQRKEKLLAQKEAIQAGYAYKLQELTGAQTLEKEKYKAEQDIKLETIKGENQLKVQELRNKKPSGKTGGYTDKELNSMDMSIRKEYNKYKADKEAALETPMSYEEYATTNYKRQADALGITYIPDQKATDAANGYATEVSTRIKGKGGSSEPMEMIAHDVSGSGDTVIEQKPSMNLPANTGDSSGGTANAGPMVVQPQPISVSADDTTSQDTSVVAKGEESKTVKAAATQVVKSSDKEVPAAAKAAVKKATAAISAGSPNTKLRDFVILSAKYIGKFSSKQWAMVTKELEAALEESREEYKSSKK
jgi:hypothetical protein